MSTPRRTPPKERLEAAAADRPLDQPTADDRTEVLTDPAAQDGQAPPPPEPPAVPGPTEASAGNGTGTLTEAELHDLGHRAGEAEMRAAAGQLPEEVRAELIGELTRTLHRLDGTAPAPDAVPAVVGPAGGAQPGATIADPVAENALNVIRFRGITDPQLQHEMTWTGILARAVMQMVVHHADNGPDDRPHLAPDDLLGSVEAAVQQIVQARRATVSQETAAP